jgi:uncharacterized repeat protein (TIGR04076 family)
MASETKKTIGFNDLLCPSCMEADASIKLSLFDLGECTCDNCGDTFLVSRAIKELTKSLEAWRKVSRWIEAGREIASE